MVSHWTWNSWIWLQPLASKPLEHVCHPVYMYMVVTDICCQGWLLHVCEGPQVRSSGSCSRHCAHSPGPYFFICMLSAFLHQSPRRLRAYRMRWKMACIWSSDIVSGHRPNPKQSPKALDFWQNWTHYSLNCYASEISCFNYAWNVW